MNLVKGTTTWFLTSNLHTFSLSFLVPTVCRLPPQTIPLIAVGAIALAAAIVAMIITIIHWLCVSYSEDGESVAPIYVND